MSMLSQSFRGGSLLCVIVLIFRIVGQAQTTDRDIKVLSGSATEDGAHLTARLDDKSVDLFCSKIISECTIAAPGEYLMVYAPPERQIYADCFNVYLYSYAKNHQRDKNIGLYCLLPP
jgi:hypothetical protein